MFSVKATYRNETRKFSFPHSVLFPTYPALHDQLRRVFPISQGYYLSKLVFSPDASKPGRILVGREVHSAEDYDSSIAPLRRQWPNPLLRFTVFDETPHKAPNVAPETPSLYSVPSVPSSEDKPKFPFAVAPAFNNGCPFPPPPPPPFNILPTMVSPPIKSFSTAGKKYCCSVAEGKADIESLLSSFKLDLDRILSTTFGTDYAEKQCASFVKPHSPGVSNRRTSLRDNTPVIPDTSIRWCFVCKASFTGIWYGCVKCPWHAVCPNCFSKSHEAHTLSFGPSHVVEQRSTNSSTRVTTQAAKEVQSHVPPPVVLPLAGDPASIVHRGVICDKCEKTIVGIRYKCLDCRDYDLCTVCIESGGMEQHNPFHEFFDIKVPRNVYVRTVSGGGRNRSPGNPQCSHAPVTQQEAARPIRHSATCNLCDSAIVGERYKCVTCPDFDTCSSCFGITIEQHPSHGFVKLRKPEDLMIRDSLPRRHVAHPARCDSCRKMIHGARYKCLHPSCPDFDLCSDCEALPIAVHPLNHPMLKMKTPDTVVPVVCGHAQATDESASPNPVLVCEESRPSESVAVSVKTPELAPVVLSDQAVNASAEDRVVAEEFLSPLGSPASNALGAALIPADTAPSHLLADVADQSPQSIHPPLDNCYQLWLRVNQEMEHLNAKVALEAGETIVDPIEDTVTESILRHPLHVTQKSSTRTRAALFASQEGEHIVTRPISPASVGYRTPSPVTSDADELHHTAERVPQQGVEFTSASQQSHPTSAFVGDTNVPDGQVFPPGAEFVKGWRMKNNGKISWPATTEIQFVAGDKFAPEGSAALKAKVGIVQPMQDLDIWTGDLKAPDTPGRYVGYWRLNDGQGNFFGSNVWIDLTVADHSDEASEHSLAASSMVMPSTNSENASAELHAPRPSLPSTKTITDEAEDAVSVVSSLSVVSMPISDDEDAEWQDTRTHSEPLEYVVLYGERSEE